jgi:UDP-N-acetylglucosamine 2-epimerase (non-hydrolysing)
MILFCFGTRPEWLKIKPIIKLMGKDEYKLLFTGQHLDLLKDLQVDYKIEIKESENRLDNLIASCLLQFPQDRFDAVLVQGDTASALACALAAFNRQLKIYYLEAGLRSYNMQHPYPEEAYRQMISRIADVCFSPTELSASNLKNEKVQGEIVVIGNTILDNLISLVEEQTYNNTVLVTMHRRENHHWIEKWFTEINNLAKQNPNLKFIIPIHPNPNVQKYKHIFTDVDVIDPLTHSELLNVLIKCKLIITDSGGLQEEGSFFNKKVIVCRKTTERPEAIDTGHLHLCESPEDLPMLFNSLIKDYYIYAKCPYGDGQSSKYFINYIKKHKNGNI